MCMRNVVFLIFVFIFSCIHAQTFTQRIQQNKAGWGSVKIYEEPAIDNLVNGLKNAKPVAQVPKREVAKPSSSNNSDQNINLGQDVAISSSNKVYKKSYAISGYRIQLYSGDDSRAARQKANAVAAKFKNYYTNIPTYTHFYSPHWICRAGDFRSYEEANNYLHEMQELNIFREAAIVKCEIQVGY